MRAILIILLLSTSGCATFWDMQRPVTKDTIDSDPRENYTIPEFVAKYGKPPIVRVEEDRKHYHLIYPQTPMTLYSMKNRADSCVDVHFKDDGQGFYLFSTMEQICSGATRNFESVDMAFFEKTYLESTRKPASTKAKRKKAKKKKRPL